MTGSFVHRLWGAVPAATDVAGQPSAQPGQWQYEVTPYLWAAGIKGDVGIGRLPTESADVSFSDLWDHFDAGAMLGFEARRNRFGIAFDGLWIKLKDSQSTPGPSFGEAQGEFTQSMYGIAGMYRVAEGRAPVDLLIGARYLGLDADLTLTAGLLPETKRSVSKSWWDGFGGVRVSVPFGDRWAGVGYVDAGAGGSKLSWQALAGVNYQFSRAISGKVGYRYFKVDYEEEDLRYDVSMGGPYLALGFKF